MRETTAGAGMQGKEEVKTEDEDAELKHDGHGAGMAGGQEEEKDEGEEAEDGEKDFY